MTTPNIDYIDRLRDAARQLECGDTASFVTKIERVAKAPKAKDEKAENDYN